MTAADTARSPEPFSWLAARSRAYAAGRAAAAEPVELPLAHADGHTLAEPLTTLTDLPAFPTSMVDGWAVRGAGPWRPMGRVLAGATAPPLTEDGTAVEIATGAMVPDGATAVLRIEESTRTPDGRIRGVPRPEPEWRVAGGAGGGGGRPPPPPAPGRPPAVRGAAAPGGRHTRR
ncbi:MAG: molybdopterin molybdenumtransferase MoeA, partial [Actinobacteria bacterium]